MQSTVIYYTTTKLQQPASQTVMFKPGEIKQSIKLNRSPTTTESKVHQHAQCLQ